MCGRDPVVVELETRKWSSTVYVTPEMVADVEAIGKTFDPDGILGFVNRQVAEEIDLLMCPDEVPWRDRTKRLFDPSRNSTS